MAEGSGHGFGGLGLRYTSCMTLGTLYPGNPGILVYKGV